MSHSLVVKKRCYMLLWWRHDPEIGFSSSGGSFFCSGVFLAYRFGRMTGCSCNFDCDRCPLELLYILYQSLCATCPMLDWHASERPLRALRLVSSYFRTLNYQRSWRFESFFVAKLLGCDKLWRWIALRLALLHSFETVSAALLSRERHVSVLTFPTTRCTIIACVQGRRAH